MKMAFPNAHRSDQGHLGGLVLRDVRVPTLLQATRQPVILWVDDHPEHNIELVRRIHTNLVRTISRLVCIWERNRVHAEYPIHELDK
jgi:hypothetical protein